MYQFNLSSSFKDITNASLTAVFLLGTIYNAVLASYQFGNPHGFMWERLSLAPTSFLWRFISNISYAFYRILVLACFLRVLAFLEYSLPHLFFDYFFHKSLNYNSKDILPDLYYFYAQAGPNLLIPSLLFSIPIYYSAKKYFSKIQSLNLCLELSIIFIAFAIPLLKLSETFLSKNHNLIHIQPLISIILFWICSYSFTLFCIAYLKNSLESILFSITSQYLLILIFTGLSINIIKTEIIVFLLIVFLLTTSYQLLSAAKSKSRLIISFQSIKRMLPYCLLMMCLVICLRVKVNYMNLTKSTHHILYDKIENTLYASQVKLTQDYYLFPALNKPIQTVTKLPNFIQGIESQSLSNEYHFRFEENPSPFKNGLDLKIYFGKQLKDTFYLNKVSLSEHRWNTSNNFDYYKTEQYFQHKNLTIVATDPIHGTLYFKNNHKKFFKYQVGDGKLIPVDGEIILINKDSTTDVQNMKMSPYFLLTKNKRYQLHSAKSIIDISSETLEKLLFSENGGDQLHYFEGSIYNYKIDEHYKNEVFTRNIKLKSLNISSKKVTISTFKMNPDKKIESPQFSQGKLYTTMFSKQKENDTYQYSKTKRLERKNFQFDSEYTIHSIDFKANISQLFTIKKTHVWQYHSPSDFYYLAQLLIKTTSKDTTNNSFKTINVAQHTTHSLTKFPVEIQNNDQDYYFRNHYQNERIRVFEVLESGNIFFSAWATPIFYKLSPKSNHLSTHFWPKNVETNPIFESRNGHIFTIPKILNKKVFPIFAKELIINTKEQAHANKN
ncbi:hypothetical protein MJH12_16485 [bacterium]|nr:hypothetical protein [bacterium]